MWKIQQLYQSYFKNFKVRFTQTLVKDLTNTTDLEEQILKTHNRAHRNALENKIQISEEFYFPKMKQKIANIVKQCKICKEAK